MDVLCEAIGVPSKGLKERQGLDDNLATTAKQAAMVWACAA